MTPPDAIALIEAINAEAEAAIHREGGLFLGAHRQAIEKKLSELRAQAQTEPSFKTAFPPRTKAQKMQRQLGWQEGFIAGYEDAKKRTGGQPAHATHAR